MEWSRYDIGCLHDMLQQKEPISNIAHQLERSRNAVVKAAKKIMFQQLLYHDPSEVAANYNMSLDELRRTIVDKKYYIPVRSQAIPQSVYVFLAVLFTAGISRYVQVLYKNSWLMW